ncbi:MAG TPA: Ku protein [Longimicrobium sp.]|nr:Ku protein [Longimicrobium sp.]
MPEWEDASEQEAVARAFWSGTITFGLVSIPVALYAANRPRGVSLRMVSPEGTPLSRRYFTSRDDRELDADEIVRGYEIEKDRFVIVDDDELERLAPERTRDIDLRHFVRASEIDPMYFERAYYLTPAGQSNKAYRLLAQVMEETDRAGIATFVMRTKEYLVAILAENGILRAETLRFADEIRTPADVGLPEPAKVPDTQVKKIDREIGKLAEARMAVSELQDRSAERLRKLVERKVRAGDDVVHLEEPEDRPSDVIDLMEILKQRLRGIQEEDGAPRASRSTPARKSAGKGGSSSGRKTASSSARKTASSSKGKTSRTTGSKTSRAPSTRATKPSRSKSTRAKSGTAELRESSKAELLQQAKKLDIPGRSGMSKDELIKAIRRTA